MAHLVTVPRPKTSQDVHIVPLAREVDRAVLPFLPRRTAPASLHAHRIILLVPDSTNAQTIAGKVERSLKAVAKVERHTLAADPERPTAGFGGILHQVSWLCRRELEQGNRVHINLSSGSKLVAFAAGLAGMAHLRSGQGSIYYVQPGGLTITQSDFEEHGHTHGMVDVEELELMPVLLPDPVQLRVLNFLRFRPGGRAEYRDLVDFLGQIPGSGYAPSRPSVTLTRRWNNATTTRMVRKIVSPLRGQGLVEVVDRGRQKELHITSRGLLYASITGLDKGKLKAPLTPEGYVAPDHPTPHTPLEPMADDAQASQSKALAAEAPIEASPEGATSEAGTQQELQA